MAGKSDYDKFLAEVLEAAPEEVRGKLEETLKHEKVAAAVKERVMARSDYSRKQDDLSEREKQFVAEVNEARGRIDGWTKWYTDSVAAEKDRQAKIDAYESTYGKIDDSARPKFTTPEDVNKVIVDTMRERDAAAIKFASLLTRLAYRYDKAFNEELDTDTLIEFAQKNGLPIEAAYDRYVNPKLEEKRTADVDARILKAKEEGRKEALSQHKLPYQSGPVEPHVLDAPADIPRAPKDRVAAAVADWMTTEHSGIF